MPDTFFSELARRFLGQGRPRPFFLWVGFYVTHSPFRFPIEFRGRFNPTTFVVPEVGAEDVDRVPTVFRDLTDGDKRGIAAAYYTSVEYLDRNVGLILDALDRSDHADDTLVIFTSDHGYLLGQHGRFEKHCCFEEAVHSALIMRLPGVIEPGRSTDALVELVDVVPTVLDVCGIEVPATVQGRSLAPLLRDQTGRHRDHVIAEYADNAEAMVRMGRWKLIYSAGNRRRRDGYALGHALPGRSVRLYDLEHDPGETTDVAGRAENAAVAGELLALLVGHLRRTARHPVRAQEAGDVHALLESYLPPWESRR
jgi:choline-sulfatase